MTRARVLGIAVLAAVVAVVAVLLLDRRPQPARPTSRCGRSPASCAARPATASPSRSPTRRWRAACAARRRPSCGPGGRPTRCSTGSARGTATTWCSAPRAGGSAGCCGWSRRSRSSPGWPWCCWGGDVAVPTRTVIRPRACHAARAPRRPGPRRDRGGGRGRRCGDPGPRGPGRATPAARTTDATSPGRQATRTRPGRPAPRRCREVRRGGDRLAPGPSGAPGVGRGRGTPGLRPAAVRPRGAGARVRGDAPGPWHGAQHDFALLVLGLAQRDLGRPAADRPCGRSCALRPTIRRRHRSGGCWRGEVDR